VTVSAPTTHVAAIPCRAPPADVPGALLDDTNAPSTSPPVVGPQGALLASIDASPASPAPHTTTYVPSSASVSTTPAPTTPPLGHHILTQFKTGRL
jgi:hypothetical protein